MMEDMDLKDLVTLSQEIGQQIQIKAYGQGYKNGFEDGKKAIEQSNYFSMPIISLSVIKDIREEVYQMTLPGTHISKGNTWESVRYGVKLALEIIDKHIADMRGDTE